VDSISWHEMIDHADAELPMSGLVDERLQPKASFKRLVAFRRAMQSTQPTPRATPPAAAADSA